MDLLPLLKKLKQIDLRTAQPLDDQGDLRYDRHQFHALTSLCSLQVLCVNIHTENLFPLLQHHQALNKLEGVNWSRVTEEQWTTLLTFPFIKNCLNLSINKRIIGLLTVDQLVHFSNVQELSFDLIAEAEWRQSTLFSSLESIFNTDNSHQLPLLLPKLQKAELLWLSVRHKLCRSLMRLLSTCQLQELHVRVDHIIATQQVITTCKLGLSYNRQSTHVKHTVLDKLMQYYHNMEEFQCESIMLDKLCKCCIERTLLGGLVQRIQHFPKLHTITKHGSVSHKQLPILKRCIQELNRRQLNVDVNLKLYDKVRNVKVQATMDNIDRALENVEETSSDDDSVSSQ